MNSFKFSFIGDISLNDDYIEFNENSSEPFIDLRQILNSDRIVLGNLECMAIGENGVNELRKTRLSTTTNTLRKYLREINLSVAFLAHNHVYDHLMDGFQKTKDVLKELNIKSLGAGKNKKVASRPLILSKNGISVGILNYVTTDTNPCISDDAPLHLNFFNELRTVQEIKELKKKVNHVVLSLHWGGDVENGFYPDKLQPKVAHSLIDAGADLIIGHHSHTLQPYEEYKGKLIFYSLGNFCFSDVKLENKIIEVRKGRNTESVIVNVDFSENQYSYHLIPIQNKNGKLNLNYHVLKRLKFRNWIFKKIRGSKLFYIVYKFRLKYVNPVIFTLTSSKINFSEKIMKFSPYKVLHFLKSR